MFRKSYGLFSLQAQFISNIISKALPLFIILITGKTKNILNSENGFQNIFSVFAFIFSLYAIIRLENIPFKFDKKILYLKNNNNNPKEEILSDYLKEQSDDCNTLLVIIYLISAATINPITATTKTIVFIKSLIPIGVILSYFLNSKILMINLSKKSSREYYILHVVLSLLWFFAAYLAFTNWNIYFVFPFYLAIIFILRTVHLTFTRTKKT